MLAAISIPIFSSRLEAAREATDVSNIRNAYAECVSDTLTNLGTGFYKEVTVKQQKKGWVSSPEKTADYLDLTTDDVGKVLGTTDGATSTVYVCVDTDGKKH